MYCETGIGLLPLGIMNIDWFDRRRHLISNFVAVKHRGRPTKHSNVGMMINDCDVFISMVSNWRVFMSFNEDVILDGTM